MTIDSKRFVIRHFSMIFLSFFSFFSLSLIFDCLSTFNSTPQPRTQVFFGQEPWMVLCSNGSAVDSVFESVSRKDTHVNFAVLDCAAQLPSKKNTFQRLKLNEMVTPPVMFFSGYGKDPKQLPSKLLRNEYVFRKEITALTKLKAVKVKDTNKLYKKCLRKGRVSIFFSKDLNSHLLVYFTSIIINCLIFSCNIQLYSHSISLMIPLYNSPLVMVPKVIVHWFLQEAS